MSYHSHLQWMCANFAFFWGAGLLISLEHFPLLLVNSIVPLKVLR